ncbi:MAG: hypothetical protein U0636_01805 [Phycisphaerales bacterium]
MPLPRLLTVSALLWAVLTLLVTLGFRVPIQPTSLSYTPAARTCVVMLAFGACALYPVARIALAGAGWSPARVALDLLVLACMFTGVFWPVQLVTYWHRSTSMALWLLIMGWIMATTGWVALSVSLQRSAARTAAAIACPAVVALGASLDAAGVQGPVPALLGPAVAILDIAPRTPSGAANAAAASWGAVLVPWACACILWSLALLRGRHGVALAARPL